MNAMKHRASFCDRTRLGPGLFSLTLSIPSLGTLEPGQFFEFKTPVRFLRRAFSVADREGDKVRFVIKVVGAGTAWLAEVPVPTELDVIGPLGQGVKMPSRGPVMLLGGGVGAAPLLYLARRFEESGVICDAVIAARSEAELLLLDEFGSMCREVILVTDDGSRGAKGYLSDILADLPRAKDAQAFYACGPEPMLAAIKRLALPSPVYAFLESRMGCGTGLCVGCAVKGSDGSYRRVCLEGPVFDLGEIEL